MSDTDMLYMASLQKQLDDRTTENIRLKKFILSIRSYYRENIAWVDLFEEQAAELITEEG